MASPVQYPATGRDHHSEETAIVWGCKVEWFDMDGKSLGFAPRQVPGLLTPTRTLYSNLVDSEDYNEAAHSSSLLHSSSDASSKDESPSHLGTLGDLQQLIFEVRSKVADLKYQIKFLDHRISTHVAMQANPDNRQPTADLLTQDAINLQIPILLLSGSKGDASLDSQV